MEAKNKPIILGGVLVLILLCGCISNEESTCLHSCQDNEVLKLNPSCDCNLFCIHEDMKKCGITTPEWTGIVDYCLNKCNLKNGNNTRN